MRQRFAIFAALGIILVLIAEWNLRSRAIAPLEGINKFWLEFCIGNSGDKLDSPSVTVVRINDDYEPLSIGEENPAATDGRLSRLDFATILGFLGKMNPKSVAFLPTPSFDESLTLNQTDIVPLKDAAMQLPRLTVAANVSNDGEQATESSPLTYEEIKVEGDPAAILSFTRTVRRPDPQLLANGDPAFKSIESARDLISEGVIRVPLVAGNRGKIAPSLVLSAIAKHAGIKTDQIIVHLDSAKPYIQLGEARQIPIEADGTFILPAHAGIAPGMKTMTVGEEGKVKEEFQFTTLTVDEIAYTGEKDDEVAKRIVEALQGQFNSLASNLVVIGFDRLADRKYQNEKEEALSETMILARTMATIQSGRFIEWWPNWMRWVAILAIAAIAWILFQFARGRFIPLWLITFLLFFGICVAIFRSTLTWTPPFFAFALFGLMLIIGLVFPEGKKKAEEPAES